MQRTSTTWQYWEHIITVQLTTIGTGWQMLLDGRSAILSSVGCCLLQCPVISPLRGITTIRLFAFPRPSTFSDTSRCVRDAQCPFSYVSSIADFYWSSYSNLSGVRYWGSFSRSTTFSNIDCCCHFRCRCTCVLTSPYFYLASRNPSRRRQILCKFRWFTCRSFTIFNAVLSWTLPYTRGGGRACSDIFTGRGRSTDGLDITFWRTTTARTTLTRIKRNKT